jgi:hypothetical protein
MGSYRQRCLEKIMALDHSVLADQLRQHQRKQQGWTDEEPPHLHQPPTSAGKPQLDKIGTVPSDTHFSSAGVKEVEGEQPDAFGDFPHSSGGVPSKYEATPSATRGRTFDEIRADNRRRQHQKYNPHSGSGGVSGDPGKPVRVRRNKYGDIISED